MIGAMFEANIKYETLDRLLKPILTNVKYSDNVNVIIDLKSILRKAYRTDVNSIVSEQRIAVEDMTSCLVNLIGFFRNYLYKSGKYSTFYVVYSTGKCDEMLAADPGYKKHYYDKYFDDKGEYENIDNICRSAVKQFATICKYLPHAIFVDSSKLDEFCYINYIVRKKVNQNDINILMSDDPILFQTLNNRTFALDIKGASTKLIAESNVIEYLTKQAHPFGGNLLGLIIAIAGNELYGIDGIDGYGYKKAAKIISRLVGDGKLVDKTYMIYPNDAMMASDAVKANAERVRKNYGLAFPIEQYIRNEVTIAGDLIQHKPIVTKAQFNELNQRMFLMYPLNIGFLLKGEKL